MHYPELFQTGGAVSRRMEDTLSGEPALKVVHVAPCLGGFGGMEAFTLRLTGEQARQGANASILWKRVRNFRLQESLQQAMRTAVVKPEFVARMSCGLLQGMRTAEIVHLHNPAPDAMAIAKMLRKPVVVTIYNHFGPGGRLHRLLWKAAARMADRRWYISDFVWSTWEHGQRVPGSGKMPVVSNLPTESVPPALRKGFVFVGRWIANKGIDHLVQAYGDARIDRSRWPLTLVGCGPLEEKLKAYIRDRRISGVSMPGFVDDDSRNCYIRAAKWMVTPPQTREDLGLTPIESRHVGVPAIITRDGGLPEAAGSHCLSCEPGDVGALTLLLEKAAAMTEAEYEAISRATQAELLHSLQPLSLYMERYREVIQQHRVAKS